MEGAYAYASVRPSDRLTKVTRANVAGMSLELPTGWSDVTDDLPEGSPPTLAREDGVGALQFSIARHSGGASASFSIQVLLSLLEEFAAAHGLAVASNSIITSEKPGRLQISANLSDSSDFIRTWYVSDGTDLVLITYTTDLTNAGAGASADLQDAEAIVATVGL